MPNYMDRGGWPRLIHAAMKAAGLDADLIFSGMGVPLEKLLAADFQYPHQSNARFWMRAEQITGDADIGLRVGLHHPVYRGQVLQYLHLSSPTFGEGLRRIFAFQRLLSDAQFQRLEHTDNSCYIALGSKVPGIDHLRHASECMICGWVRYLREMSEGVFTVTLIEFSCAAPAQPEWRSQVFGCPVRYGATESRIYFDPTVLARPSPNAEPELFCLHERIAAERLKRIASQDFVEAVHGRIGALLESGKAKPKYVAQNLGISESQLVAGLAELKTSFTRELDACRFQLAKQLLTQTDVPISEICYLTNFSEPSALYRAFKRWCGERPIQYRERRRAQALGLKSVRGAIDPEPVISTPVGSMPAR